MSVGGGGGSVGTSVGGGGLVGDGAGASGASAVGSGVAWAHPTSTATHTISTPMMIIIFESRFFILHTPLAMGFLWQLRGVLLRMLDLRKKR